MWLHQVILKSPGGHGEKWKRTPGATQAAVVYSRGKQIPLSWRLVVSEDGAGDNREHKRVRANIVSMCLQKKLAAFKYMLQ